MRLLWLGVLASQLAAVVGFWAWNHVHHPLGNQLTGDSTAQFLAWGRLAGLLAAFGCLLQIVLVGRTRWVERAFGLDRLSRLHHVVGFGLVLAIVAHPVLVTAGHALQEENSFGGQFAAFLKNWEDVAGATVAVGIMLAALVFSVLVLRRKMRYEWWHATHLTFYIAIALAFGHQLAVGWDFDTNLPPDPDRGFDAHRWFRYYWLGLYVFVFANLLWYRVARPLAGYWRHRFRVARLVPEAGAVTSVHIEGRRMERFLARGGQFVIVRFLARGFRWEAHPFSLSAPPDGRRLRLTIKALGDYTRKIPELAPGTGVIIDGPHGIFTAGRCKGAKALLVAGGIGITPIRSMAEDLARRGTDLVLLYANRDRKSIVFETELAELAAATGRLKVIHVLSADPDWAGERGQIDRERLARLVPDVREREVFLCGPPPMMKAVRAALRNLGVPRGRIYYERFAL
ncbi:MAG TPA: ferredoxin reductase family protein [Planctomycetota bacterium]|nr:ferredoxin reductase family protein [Planctomycetota bacterium]